MDSTLGIIVFARMESKRLPGKMMLPIAGRTLLDHVLDRAREIPGSHETVVATSTRPADDIIADAAQGQGIAVFRGSLDDVAGRAVACAQRHGFENFVRLCGDSPFYDGRLAWHLMERHKQSGADLTTNTFPRTFPPGVSVEVVTTDALSRVLARTSAPEDREHVTRYFYEHPSDFQIENFAAEQGTFDDVSLVIDEPRDLAYAEQIMHRLKETGPHMDLERIIAIARTLDPASSTPPQHQPN